MMSTPDTTHPDVPLSSCIYHKLADYTMTPALGFEGVLEVAASVADVPGDVVECGVWKGGMIAGIAQLLDGLLVAGHDPSPQRARHYHLFDSFEGLLAPDLADSRDGQFMADGRRVKNWVRRTNFATRSLYAREAMEIAGVGPSRYTIHEGWFEDTLPLTSVASTTFPEGLALVRIDADLYTPTMLCLKSLFDRVNPGGVVIIDDYVFLPGVGRAVHDFLATRDPLNSEGLCVEHLDTGTGTPVEAVYYIRKPKGEIPG